MSCAILCILSYGHIYNIVARHLCCISTKSISRLIYFLDVYYMGHFRGGIGSSIWGPSVSWGDTGVSRTTDDSGTSGAWTSETYHLREGGGSDASLGDTCLLREEEDGEAWALEVDVAAWTGVSETWLFFLWTNECCAILLCLSLSSLWTIVHVSKPNKCQTITTSKKRKKSDR